MHKILVFALIAIVLLLAGCSQNDESLTIGKKAPFKTYVDESEVTQTDTVYLYHKDGYVTKTDYVTECVLKDGGDYEGLKSAADYANLSFNQERFQIKGFRFLTKLTDTSYSTIITFDYTQMNIKEELGKSDIFNLRDLTDENLRVPYDKAIKYYTKYGFVWEEKNSG